MASHTGRLVKLSFIKETAWGTYLDPDKGLSVTADNLENKLSHIEDGRFIGEIMQSDMILVGEEVDGNLPLTVHPNEIGQMLFFTLMKTDAPTTSPEALLLVYYTGADPYASVVNTLGVMQGKSGADVGTATQKWIFDTTAAAYDTAAELQAAIDLIADWKAYIVGVGTTACSKIANFVETQIHGMHVMRFVSSSTTTKEHKIYPAGAADSEPSMSICSDRTLGAGKAIGLTGCKINSLSLDIESRKEITMSVSISGKKEELSKTYPVITIVQDKPYVASNVSAYLNGVKITSIKKLGLNINNNLSKDGSIGSTSIQEQIRQGVQAVISGTLNLVGAEWETYYPIVTSDTPMEMFIVMEHAEYADLTNVVKFLTTIRISSVKFTKWAALPTGPNRITVEINGNAVNNVYYENVEIQVIDQTAAAY